MLFLCNLKRTFSIVRHGDMVILCETGIKNTQVAGHVIDNKKKRLFLHDAEMIRILSHKKHLNAQRIDNL
ncbi:hypothetical protein Thiofri_02635 [Thiorhodovibrio frisius]|nr:hypothetical protein Thiofri_02635 [Thiorhodovibrio frisius]